MSATDRVAPAPIDDPDPVGPFTDHVCAAFDRLPAGIRDTVTGECRAHRYGLADVVAAFVRATYHPEPLAVLPGDVVGVLRHFHSPLAATRALEGEVPRLWRQSSQAMLYRPPPWPEAECIGFRGRLDDAIRAENGGTLPWERPVASGGIDYFRMSAILLDEIDDIVACLLPIGRRHSGAIWRGRRTPEGPEIVVDLLSGRWRGPTRHGRDLVGLLAFVLEERPHRVVRQMQTLFGVTAVRHV